MTKTKKRKIKFNVFVKKNGIGKRTSFSIVLFNYGDGQYEESVYICEDIAKLIKLVPGTFEVTFTSTHKKNFNKQSTTFEKIIDETNQV